MTSNELKVDFHCHSTISDGAVSPDEVVRRAKRNKVDVLALTDHDCVDGYERAKRVADEVGIRLVLAAEFSCYLGEEPSEKEIHVLSFFADDAFEGVREYCQRMMAWRQERVRSILRGLASKGFGVSEGDANAAVGDCPAPTRLHLKNFLRSRGLVREDTVWDHLGNHHEYVTQPPVTSRELFADIANLGGVTVWAHPYPNHFEKYAERLADEGLQGVEILNVAKSSLPGDVYQSFAVKRGLFTSCGSDWHGKPPDTIKGPLALSSSLCESLLERLGVL
ncbi:MAG: PHP domain-containing protein [Planctomycetes bacterium]|nr:PHP domain-containing protein [Planctomycetota bacterium]